MVKRTFRTSEGLNGEKLDGCSACWNCYFFNIEFMECWLHYRSLDFGAGEVYKYIVNNTVFKKPVIKDPGWQRCVYWKEKVDEN